MRLAALILALAVAPAAASTPAASCLRAPSGNAPNNLDQLRDCQARARAAAVAAAADDGAPLTPAQFDQIDDFQRAEAREFLSSTELVQDGGPPVKSETPTPTNKLGGATAAELGRMDAKSSGEIQGLQGRLQAAAGDGKDGVTPAMADDIRSTLIQAQGGVSPDMKALLDGVQRDGGTLTPGTMKLLQGAGKAAKSDGLDLGIDPKIEKPLLEDDFDKDEAAQPPAGM